MSEFTAAIPWKPHGYQKKAVRWGVSRAAAGLFLDPGLGKTSIMLAVLKILQREKLVRHALVIAPLRVAYSVWPEEARKWRDFAHLRVAVLHGPRREEAARRPADVYVLNPEGLSWYTARLRAGAFELPDALIVDESTRFKNARALCFRLLKPLLPRFRRRYALTGTPAPNGLIDLFGQLYVIDQGAALGRFISQYRNEYFVAAGFGGYRWVPQTAAEPGGKGATERIYERISPVVLRLDADDYLRLPPKIVTDVRVDLPPKARKVYEKLEKELVLQLAEGRVTATNAAVLTSKTRQVASGSIYLDEKEGDERKRRAGVSEIHAAKLDALVDLVEELSGQPTLIAYDFIHERERLLRVLPKGTPYLGGGVSGKRGLEIERAFGRGEVPLLLAHPRSAGHGLNLQAGKAIVFFSLTWDLELYDQSIRRIWRQGQTGRVFVYRLVARDTIDEVIVAAIARKTKTQKELLDLLRQRYVPRRAA